MSKTLQADLTCFASLIKATSRGVELAIRVLPRARKTELAGTRGGVLLLRLAAPPVDGAANAALIEWLAGDLGVPLRAIRIVSGHRSRDKRVAIDGITVAHVTRSLGVDPNAG
jgi:uncharacterized protein (TIGR00251 family)